MQGTYVPVDCWLYVPQGILCEETQYYIWTMVQIMLDKQRELIDSGEYELELPWGDEDEG